MKIRVLHVLLSLKVGGLEKFVVDLVRHYQNEVVSVLVCLNEKGDDWADEGIFQSLYEMHAGEGLRISSAWRLAQIVKNEKIDVIHTHNPAPHFYGTLAGLLCSVPVIHTKHGRNYPNVFRKVILNRFSAVLSDKVIGVSHDAANVCHEIEKIPLRKIETIFNGVDTNRFLPRERSSFFRKLGIDENIPVVGIVARLSPEKDHATLLKAVQKLFLRKRLVHLLIVGDGPLMAPLKSLVSELGINQIVSFAGMKNDVEDIVPGFDVFALSSLTEGISLTLLEAMSCEIPIVATDVGGNGEVVQHGQTGFIVPKQDPEALAQAIDRLLEDKALQHKMGQAGRKRVLERFSLAQTANKYLSVYREVLGISE